MNENVLPTALVLDEAHTFVKKIGNDVEELSLLPTKKAILMGWAAPIPTLVEMRELEKGARPESSDPDFWEVWTGLGDRKVDWEHISKGWQE